MSLFDNSMNFRSLGTYLCYNTKTEFQRKNVQCLGCFADLDGKATIYHVNFKLFVNTIGVS